MTKPLNSCERKRDAPVLKAKTLLIFSVLFLLGLGLLYLNFTRQVHDAIAAGEPISADAIVVLTGEPERLGAAVRLLDSEFGERLLISGVNSEVSPAALKQHLNADRRTLKCCIDLDYLSLNTAGNARNTSYWANFHNFKRLIIVTNDYHMPRSLALMRRAMPDVELIPASVPTKAFRNSSLIELTLSPVILREFGKYLVAQLGLGPTVHYFRTSAYI